MRLRGAMGLSRLPRHRRLTSKLPPRLRTLSSSGRGISAERRRSVRAFPSASEKVVGALPSLREYTSQTRLHDVLHRRVDAIANRPLHRRLRPAAETQRQRHGRDVCGEADARGHGASVEVVALTTRPVFASMMRMLIATHACLTPTTASVPAEHSGSKTV